MISSAACFSILCHPFYTARGINPLTSILLRHLSNTVNSLRAAAGWNVRILGYRAIEHELWKYGEENSSPPAFHASYSHCHVGYSSDSHKFELKSEPRSWSTNCCRLPAHGTQNVSKKTGPQAFMAVRVSIRAASYLVGHLSDKVAETSGCHEAALLALSRDALHAEVDQSRQNLTQRSRRVDHDALPHVYRRVTHRWRRVVPAATLPSISITLYSCERR
jgi:hypothetical protein